MSEIKEGDKLYLVTRKDLSPGQRAVQAAHALQEFAIEYPETNRAWYDNSNYLAILEVENEEALEALAGEAHGNFFQTVWFYEPDMENQLTAIAIEPQGGKRLCSNLPLALR